MAKDFNAVMLVGRLCLNQ